MYPVIEKVLDNEQTYQSLVKQLINTVVFSDYQITGFNTLCTHTQTITFLVNKRLVVKLSVSDRLSQNDVAKCYTNWRLNNIPTLDVIASGSTERFEYLVTKYIEAIDGNKLALQSHQSFNLASELGTIAAKLHSSKPSEISYLNSGVDSFDTWLKYNRQKLDRRCDRLYAKGLLSNKEMRRVKNKFEGLQERDCELVELHGDLTPFNVLADSESGSVKALHDPDSLFGDPLHEVAYFTQSIKRQYKNLQSSKAMKDTGNYPEIERFTSSYKNQAGIKFSAKDISVINIYESALYINKLDYRSNFDPDNELPLIKELFLETL